MYRLSGMTTSAGATVVNGVSYNAANQLLGMTYNGIGETRGYNVLNQLTSIAAGSTENLTYNYPTGTNNGKISSMYNAVSGETITYAYDSLNRLATAAGSGWGEAYTFDGFGNLNAKTVTSGSGPSLSLTTNPANNQMDGIYETTYDANGNVLGNATGIGAYDAENRISSAGFSSGTFDYGYDAQNRRTFLWPKTYDTFPSSDGGNPTGYSVVLYSPTGQKLGTYQINDYDTSTTNYVALSICSTLMSSDQYFGARRLAVIDQLGSAGTYYPWGENKGTTSPQNTWGFGTYWEDSATGLDYANNRYYSNAYGRFMTPDPYQGASGGSGDPDNPQSWNRYAYTVGDPVNWVDPSGQFYQPPQPPPPPDQGPPPFVNSNQTSSPSPSQQKGQHATWNTPPPLLNCHQIAAGASNGATPGSVTAARNSAFSSVNTAVTDLDQYVQESFTAAQMTWQFFSGTGPGSQTFGPSSQQSMSMAASMLLDNAIAAYLQNPSNPKNQSGVLNFGFTALLAAGVNPTQQFVGSFAFNISTLPNGALDVTLTNTTSFSSLMRFVQYFGLPVPGSWTRGTFPIMGNINQTFNLNMPCQQ